MDLEKLDNVVNELEHNSKQLLMKNMMQIIN